MHVPQYLREEMGLGDQVVVHREKQALVVEPLAKIENPLGFLSSLHIKTKKTPLEMKRETEEVFA